jgi:hypothetical protein
VPGLPAPLPSGPAAPGPLPRSARAALPGTAAYQLASGSFHSDGSGSVTPPAAIAASADILISLRAALSMRKASGSSTKAADARLSQMLRVPRSRITSNQASHHSRVAVTSRKAIAIWRPRHSAQAVRVNPASSKTSNPTQASRQCVAVKSLCSVNASTTIHAASTTAATTENSAASRRLRLRFRSSSGCGWSIAASMRASWRRSAGLMRRSSASVITVCFFPRGTAISRGP